MERCLVNCKPAVLLLDSDLPRMAGIRSFPAIRCLCPSIRIILLGDENDDEQSVCALKAGVKGFCAKEIDSFHLRKALNAVKQGEMWVRRKTICHLLEELISYNENRVDDSILPEEVYLRHLTPREYQIALLVGEGACNKEISNRLNITERTVKAHLTAIFQKLRITDRLHLGLFVAAQNHAKPSPRFKRTHIRPESNATKVQLTT
jgi:DNA-binding NarL/FixJ family response regulator